MAKFKYKFDSLKQVKKALEKKAMKEVSLIEIEISGLKERLLKSEAEKSNLRRDFSTKKNIKAREVQFFNSVIKTLDSGIKELNDSITRLELKKKNKITELIQKSKEHKIFESLREKHQEKFNFEQNKLEQKEIDDIAGKKFSREKI